MKIWLHDRSDERENSNSEMKVADDCLSTNILAAEAKAINNEGGQAYVNGRVKHRKLQVRSKQKSASSNLPYIHRTPNCLFAEAC